MSAAPPTAPGRDHHTTRAVFELERKRIGLREWINPSKVAELWEPVTDQDDVLCERARLGVSSRAFDHGIRAEKDALPHAFDRTYLAARGRP